MIIFKLSCLVFRGRFYVYLCVTAGFRDDCLGLGLDLFPT